MRTQEQATEAEREYWLTKGRLAKNVDTIRNIMVFFCVVSVIGLVFSLVVGIMVVIDLNKVTTPPPSPSQPYSAVLNCMVTGALYC